MMKDSSRKEKRKRDHVGDEHKKSKGKSSKKDKKRRKEKKEEKERRGLVSEEVLLTAGSLSEDQYFEKHAEFATWLFEDKGQYFNDLSSEESHSQFLKFVEAWNSGKLKKQFYEGIAAAPARRTQHNWHLRGEDDQPSKRLHKKTGSRDESEDLAQRKQKIQPASRRLAFGAGCFCLENTEENEGPRVNVREPRGPSLQETGRTAAARMMDGSHEEHNPSLAQLKALVDGSSGAIQIRKREQ